MQEPQKCDTACCRPSASVHDLTTRTSLNLENHNVTAQISNCTVTPSQKMKRKDACELYLPTPPPCSKIVCLSSFSTFLLSSARSSGLMTLASSCSSSPTCLPLSVPEVDAWSFAGDALDAVLGPGPATIAAANLRCRACGAEGKLPFLSIVSTVR